MRIRHGLIVLGSIGLLISAAVVHAAIFASSTAYNSNNDACGHDIYVPMASTTQTSGDSYFGIVVSGTVPSSDLGRWGFNIANKTGDCTTQVYPDVGWYDFYATDLGNFGLATSALTSTSTIIIMDAFDGTHGSMGHAFPKWGSNYCYFWSSDSSHAYAPILINNEEPSTTFSSWYGGSQNKFNAEYALGDSEADIINYFDSLISSSTPEDFYAKIQNTASHNMRAGTSTADPILKTLPAEWIIHVVSTTYSGGSPITNSSGTWYKVVDPTDDVTGWMVASSTGTQYISSYDGGAQTALEASSSDQIATGTAAGHTADYIVDAVDHYYNNIDTSSSLYSSDDGSNLPVFRLRGFPEKVILGIAAAENGPSFNNEIVTFDYGHGIMQITPFQVFAHEPTSTGDWISNPENLPTDGSHIAIPPCAMEATDTYINCYSGGGTGNGSRKPYMNYAGDPSNPTYKFYSNTSQSIYANVKDGMTILAEKYGNVASSTPTNRVCNYTSSTVDIPADPPFSSAITTYSCTDREIVLVTAAYNGTSSYLFSVASTTSNISDYFVNETSSDASTTDIINKMFIASDHDVYAQLHSPGDLSIQDTHGHTVGMVDGKVVNTFPFASYDPQTKIAHIFFPQDSSLTYKVVGTGSGVYGLDIDIASGTQKIAFHRDENVSITPGEVHSYTVDTNAIAHGKNGVTFKIDKKGDGTINETDQFGAVLTTVQQPKSLPLTSVSYVPVVLPNPPAKKIIAPPVYIPSMIVTSTLGTYTSTSALSSSTLELDVASFTMSTSTTN